MPLLSEEDQKRLLGPTALVCGDCGSTLIRNYCRECDEFFFECDCTKTGMRHGHEGHRTY